MKPIIIIAGPTAVGKTDLTIQLAKHLKTDIISADSMQIYSKMNIGTATPSEEEKEGIEHHLMSFLDPKLAYSVAQYSRDARLIIDQMHTLGKIPIITGGTGLYINSLLYEMTFGNTNTNEAIKSDIHHDLKVYGMTYLYEKLKKLAPEAAKRIHPNNHQKIQRALEIALSEGEIKDFKQDLKTETKYQPYLFILNRERQTLYQRINMRVEIMMQAGLLQEVESLKSEGLTANHQSMKGIGYKETLQYLDGECTYKDLVDKIKQNSRHYAKRQLTWFRRYSMAEWINLSSHINLDNVIEYIVGSVKEESLI